MSNLNPDKILFVFVEITVPEHIAVMALTPIILEYDIVLDNKFLCLSCLRPFRWDSIDQKGPALVRFKTTSFFHIKLSIFIITDM